MSEQVKEVVREDKIKISDEVIMTIAGIAAAEVENVTAMGGGFSDGIAGILGKKNPGKGVKVEVIDKEIVIDLSITVKYGCMIHEVARNLQSRVREAVQNMTGMKVAEINVHVQGVNFGKEVKKEESVEEETE